MESWTLNGLDKPVQTVFRDSYSKSFVYQVHNFPPALTSDIDSFLFGFANADCQLISNPNKLHVLDPSKMIFKRKSLANEHDAPARLSDKQQKHITEKILECDAACSTIKINIIYYI